MRIKSDLLLSRSLLVSGIVILLSASALADDIRDSTDLSFGGGGGIEDLERYDEVKTYPYWDDIRNKPATATRWPRFNEVTDRPSYYPTTWSQIAGKPDSFAPDEHDHDGRYLRTIGGGLSGSLTAPGMRVGNDPGGSMPGKLVVAAGKGEPEIMLHGTGTLTAQTTLNLVSQNGLVRFGKGGPGHEDVEELARISSAGNLTAKGALIAEQGVRPFVTTSGQGDNVIQLNYPKGLSVSYVGAAHGGISNKWPHQYGQYITVNSTKHRGFQLFKEKNRTGGARMLHRSCHVRNISGYDPDEDDGDELEAGLKPGQEWYCEPWLAAVHEDADGNVGIGVNLARAKLDVRGDAHFGASAPRNVVGAVNIRTDAAVQPDIWFDQRAMITAEHRMGFGVEGGTTGFQFRHGGAAENDSTVIAQINSSGVVYSGGYQTLSDARLKEDVRPLEGALDQIRRLRGVSYSMKSDSDGGRHLGLIAQEVQAVFPQAVSRMEADEGDGYLSVNYTALVAPMIESIKQLDAENREKDARIADLEERLERLESLLAE